MAGVFLSLDTEKAIACIGDKDIYLNVLKKFVPNRGGTVQSIRDALAAADLNKALHLAHTLKGISATIGAFSLAESARKLEAALRNNIGNEYSSLLDAIAEEMVIVTTQIAAYLKTHEILPELNALQPLASVMAQLTVQLEDFDCVAAATMVIIRQQIKGSDIEKRFNQLESYINAYDFENALAEIKRLSASL